MRLDAEKGKEAIASPSEVRTPFRQWEMQMCLTRKKNTSPPLPGMYGYGIEFPRWLDWAQKSEKVELHAS